MHVLADLSCRISFTSGSFSLCPTNIIVTSPSTTTSWKDDSCFQPRVRGNCTSACCNANCFQAECTESKHGGDTGGATGRTPPSSVVQAAAASSSSLTFHWSLRPLHLFGPVRVELRRALDERTFSSLSGASAPPLFFLPPPPCSLGELSEFWGFSQPLLLIPPDLVSGLTGPHARWFSVSMEGPFLCVSSQLLHSEAPAAAELIRFSR